VVWDHRPTSWWTTAPPAGPPPPPPRPAARAAQGPRPGRTPPRHP
jgi:hypothetical protein